MADNVSPFLIVYLVELDLVVLDVLELVELAPGMVKVRPAYILLGLLILLAAAKALTVVP